MTKEYLGDGVYIDFNGQNIVLTTENGLTQTNIIFLEWELVEKFKDYVNRTLNEIKK